MNKWYMPNSAAILMYETRAFLGLKNLNRTPNLGETNRHRGSQQKKDNLPNSGLKGGEKRVMYLNLTRELKINYEI